LRSRDVDFELWIAGEGPRRDALEDAARPLIDDGFIRFLGAFDPNAIGVLYTAADVFVMPSFRDYRSVAVLEALRFGTPVIDSVRDGNVGDFVIDGVTGRVFDPAEQRSLVGALEAMISRPQERVAMAARVDELMDRHTPTSAATALRDVIEVVDGSSRAGS
jgi:glycosyltransferase involved in cell wall biosynthesis